NIYSMIVAIVGSVVVLLIYNAITGRRQARFCTEIAIVISGRKAMANPEDAIRSAVPGGIAKPLMLAVLALLASGALFGGGGKESSATKGPQPTPDEGAGSLLGGLGGLFDKLQKGGLGNVVNSWIG